MWAITLKGDPKLIGTIVYWHIVKEKDEAEIGYEMLPDYFGKGIMQEAISSVLHYGFHTLNLQTITAFPSSDNKSSIKLLVKNDFIVEDDGVERGSFVRYVLHRS